MINKNIIAQRKSQYGDNFQAIADKCNDSSVSPGKKYKQVVFSDALEEWKDFLPHLERLNIWNKEYKITIEEL